MNRTKIAYLENAIYNLRLAVMHLNYACEDLNRCDGHDRHIQDLRHAANLAKKISAEEAVRLDATTKKK